MATPYNPYNANMPFLSPYQQRVEQQRRADRQASQSRGKKARPEHLQAIRDARKIARVRVEPTSDEFRRVISHPNAGSFRRGGSLEWPNDRFTQRRIADGSVRVVETIENGSERKPVTGASNRRSSATTEAGAKAPA